jgi:hypothetical protein
MAAEWRQGSGGLSKLNLKTNPPDDEILLVQMIKDIQKARFFVNAAQKLEIIEEAPSEYIAKNECGKVSKADFKKLACEKIIADQV